MMQGVRVTREEVKLPSDKVGTAQMDEPCIAQNDLGSKRCPAAAKLPDPKMEVAERIFALPSYDRGIMRNPPKRFLPLTENDPLFQRLRSHFFGLLVWAQRAEQRSRCDSKWNLRDLQSHVGRHLPAGSGNNAATIHVCPTGYTPRA